MILVDSSVWIDHLRTPIPRLLRELRARNVLMHSLVLGELACGTIRNRAARLKEWRSLRHLQELPHDEVIALIEANGLIAVGLGFVDAHLLFATVHDGEASLWTRDARLRRACESCGVAFEESV